MKLFKDQKTIKKSLLTAILLYFIAVNVQATANTYTVNATTDTGSGSGLSGDLRYCITQANSNPGSTINFSVAANSTITLSSNMVPIQTNMTIDGSGSSGLKIDGNSRCEPWKRVKRARRVVRGSRSIFCETSPRSAREK